MATNIKTVVSSQLPEFVREDYPAFKQFVEAYYEFLDQTEKRNLTDIKDIEKTTDEFLSHLKATLNIFGESSYEGIDNVLLMRKVKQIFTAKGSESAYRFLFRILFDKPVDISYPWDQVLKASDGKWKQETSIFVRVVSGIPDATVGNNLLVSGSVKKIKVFVERVVHSREDIYEIFIDKNYYGNIDIGDTVDYDGFSGIIVPTSSSYVVENPGTGYKVGDLIRGVSIAGSSVIEQLIKVTKVNANKGIERISIVKYGGGYSDEFYVITSKQNTINTAEFAVSRDSVPLYSIPDDTVLDKYQDFGYIIDSNYWNVEYSNPTYAGQLIREFYAETPNSQGDVEFALIKFNIGAVAKYPGYYISNDGFLDDIIKIQDSKYYQKYSYLLTVDERLEDYKSILKSYLHTAGTALFSEYQIQNTYNPGLSVSMSLDIYKNEATFNTINKVINNKFILPADVGGRIRINPYDLEAYFAEVDYNPETYQTFTG